MNIWKPTAVIVLLVLCIFAIPWSHQPPEVFAQNPVSGEPFNCVVPVTTVTVITAVGGSCGLPGTDQSLYITDILFSSNSAGISADTFPTLKYGLTTATVTVFWGSFLLSTGNITPTENLRTPIKIPPGNQIYFINSTAGSKFIVIGGVKGPGL